MASKNLARLTTVNKGPSGRIEPDPALYNSKQLSDLLGKIQENISKSLSKNDSLLEAIESSEVRATQTGSNEAPLLRNLRARLAAAHAPYSALRRDLGTFAGIFEKRCGELERAIEENAALRKRLTHDNHDLEVRIKSYEQERSKFEEERAVWKEESERTKEDIIEQNDRLTVLSEKLAGTKTELDASKNELASQRIAFEEEKLARLEGDAGLVPDSEAEALRIKLKQQVIRNVELENALLRTELGFYQKEEQIKELQLKNNRIEQDIQERKMASTRAVKQFEGRIVEANKKLTNMNSELVKSQEHCRRFQDLLSSERRKQKGLKHALEQELQRKTAGSSDDTLTPAGQKAYIETLAQTLTTPTKAHGAGRAEDVVRKSEAVMVENTAMKAEIRKLRIENGELMKRVRFADTNAHYMRNQVATSIADRAELLKRLDKAETQYQELQQSLTKQASEWVALKKRESKSEKGVKWSQLQPVPVLGASERTWGTPNRSQTLSRSIQVQKW